MPIPSRAEGSPQGTWPWERIRRDTFLRTSNVRNLFSPADFLHGGFHAARRGPNGWAKSSSIPDLHRMMLRINDRDVPIVDGSLMNPLLEQKTDIFEFAADLSSERSSLPPLRILPHVLSYVQRHVLAHQWQNLKQKSLKRTSERRWLWPHKNWERTYCFLRPRSVQPLPRRPSGSRSTGCRSINLVQEG